MARRYKAYPAYKDSGVEWLGEIPEGWRIFALKRSMSSAVNGVWGSEPTEENDTIVIRVADFNRSTLTVSDEKLTYRSIDERDLQTRKLKKGDLLIEKSGGGEKTLVGCVVLFDKNYIAVTSNFVAKATPLSFFSGNFLKFAFSYLYSIQLNSASIKQTTGIQNLDSDSYFQERFSFPSYKEQQTIAQFLDYETAKIDALIAKQEQLIELLKEKRQAVISHAVTKGLNPDAPMKDSGVEWLGQVPEHWEVSALRWKIKIASGDSIAAVEIQQTQSDDYTIQVVGGNGVLGFTNKINVLKECIAIGRVGALCGNIHLVSKNSWITDNALKVSRWSHFDRKYLAIILDSAKLNDYASKTAQPLITSEQVKSLKVTLPPLKEQLEINIEIERVLNKYSNLERKSLMAIELLQERKTALISAAVTGKIDVRDWQPPSVG